MSLVVEIVSVTSRPVSACVYLMHMVEHVASVNVDTITSPTVAGMWTAFSCLSLFCGVFFSLKRSLP